MPVDVISQSDRRESSDSVSIRDYIDAKILSVENTIDRLSQEKSNLILSELKRIDEMASQRDQGQEAQFDAIAEATRIATAALDKRLEGMNEFRQQLSDWANKFITRADSETANKYLREAVSIVEVAVGKMMSRSETTGIIDSLSKRVSALEAGYANMQGRLWVVGAIVVLVSMALRFVPLAH